MTEKTTLLEMEFPEEYTEPYFTEIQTLYETLDAWIQANHEDKFLIFSGGGETTLDGDSFAWSEDIVIRSLKSSAVITISASSTTVADGEILYVTPTSRPLSTETLTLQAGSTANKTRNLLPIGIRTGSDVFLYLNSGSGEVELPINDGEQGTLSVATGLPFENVDSEDITLPWFSAKGNLGMPSGNKCTTSGNEFNWRNMRPGVPLKIVDNSEDLRYGVVISRNNSHEFDFSGPSCATGEPVSISFASPERVIQIDLKIPGLWDGGTSTKLFEDFAEQFKRWHLSKAYLVKVDARSKTQDTGASNPAIGVTIGGSDVLSTSLEVGSSWVSKTSDFNASNYEIDFDDVIEIKNVTNGTNQDSSDLTVSLTFVVDESEEGQEYEPGGSEPWIKMIIGPTNGGNWCGLGQGVHTLVPTDYDYVSSSKETWEFIGQGTPTTVTSSTMHALRLRARSVAGDSNWIFRYTSTFLESEFTTGIDGKIKDRLFASGLIVNGVSFTWQRGGNQWQSQQIIVD